MFLVKIIVPMLHRFFAKLADMPKIASIWLLFCSMAAILVTTDAIADYSPLPWTEPLEKIAYFLTGPVAKILGIIAIALAGLGIAFGEAGTGLRRLFQVVLGLSIAFTASNLLQLLFNFAG